MPDSNTYIFDELTNTCRSEANRLKLFKLLTICGSKSINYSTLRHVTWIKIWLIIQKWPNFIWYSSKCYLIFAFFASPTIQFRHQSFAIHFGDESQSGTPLCWNLMWNKNVTCLYRYQACLESGLSQFSDPHHSHSGFRTVLQVTWQ